MPALVWIHFEALSDIQARCKYCAAVLTVTNGSTKGLWTHVSRKHKQEHLTFNYETKEAVEQIQAIAKEPIVRGIASRQQAVKVESKGKSEEKPPLPPIEITKKAEPKRKRRLKYRENSIGAMLKSVLQSGEPKTIDEKLNETIENVLANGLLKKDDKEQDEEQAKEKLDQRKNAVVEEPLFKFSVKEEMISDSEEPSTSKNSHSDSTISLGSTLSAAFYVEYRKTLKEFGYTLSPEMEQSGGEPVPAFSVSTLIEAFRATVSRDYEKAISLVRNTVKSGHAFTADDLELLDHVFACVLNTSHYDETMIEVCWEWIEAFERPPRTVDARVVAGSTLSIYFAYHTICRVQERMPKKPNYVEIRRKTWNKIIESFEYLTACAIALWKVVDLDRLEMLVNWSYLALQFSDVCDDETLMKLKLAKDEVSENLCATVLLENGHLVGERAATLERNLVDTALRKGTSIARIMEKSNPITELPTSKKPRMADG